MHLPLKDFEMLPLKKTGRAVWVCTTMKTSTYTVVLPKRHWLAVLRGETTATAPAEYVAGLFDGYAERVGRGKTWDER